VKITGELTEWIGREEVDLLAQRAEGEAAGCAGIEVRFVEHDEAACGDDGAVGDTEACGIAEGVGEVPAADVGGCVCWVKEFDGIDLGKVGVGQGFIDDDVGECRGEGIGYGR
jgi:hypothetical protein